MQQAAITTLKDIVLDTGLHPFTGCYRLTFEFLFGHFRESKGRGLVLPITSGSCLRDRAKVSQALGQPYQEIQPLWQGQFAP